MNFKTTVKFNLTLREFRGACEVGGSWDLFLHYVSSEMLGKGGRDWDSLLHYMRFLGGEGGGWNSSLHYRGAYWDT